MDCPDILLSRAELFKDEENIVSNGFSAWWIYGSLKLHLLYVTCIKIWWLIAIDKDLFFEFNSTQRLQIECEQND